MRREGRSEAVTALPGGLVTRRRGQGLETAEIRAFVHGDDPRHIDRNATARLGRPQVRSFQAERDRTRMLIADFRPSMLWGTRRTFRSAAAAEALSLAGWRAIGESGRVGLIAATGQEAFFFPPRGRERGMVALIGMMIRAHMAALEAADAPDPPLAEAVAMALRLTPRGGEAVLASGLDAVGPGFAAALQELGRRATLSVLRIADPFETAPPPGRYRFRTAEGALGTGAVDRVTESAAAGAALPADIPVSRYDAAIPPEEQPRHG